MCKVVLLFLRGSCLASSVKFPGSEHQAAKHI